jgi:TolB-like protein
MTATRRLAAILVADVVGYSRLMEADEAGTLAAMEERYHGTLEPALREFGGRIVKTMGDGVLAEFASAVNAVKAALALQERMAGANDGLAEDRRIALRIGINLGDVVGDGDDVFGDGVNIAARLEALAPPGGICVSAKVHDEARGKVEAEFADLGEQKLKNIVAPVRAYAWPTGAVARPASGKPSIAVLPFANMSGEPEQQYFSDGITEDIITELARFRNLHVIARNSSFRHRGSDLDMIRVGRELGADYLVEGSVRKLGPRIRISVQLIDAKTEHHLWAEKFDRAMEQIFTVQDQVVRTIVGSLSGRLSAAGAELAKRKPPASLAAYECVLQADALPLADPALRLEARRLYQRALELDPNYARAHALLSINYNMEWDSRPDTPPEFLDRALDHAKRAVALDENDGLCHDALALAALNHRDFALAEHHHLRAIELNPNQPGFLASAGFLFNHLGEPERAIAYFKEARLADPLFEPSWYWPALGAAHFNARQYEEALDAFARAPRPAAWQHALAAACHAFLDRPDMARKHAEEALKLAPGFTATRFFAKRALKREEDRRHGFEGMIKAGLPE